MRVKSRPFRCPATSTIAARMLVLCALEPGFDQQNLQRWRPVNIRLLIVPSGWLSCSASSDWVNPP